jgi:hypothetical protein
MLDIVLGRGKYVSFSGNQMCFHMAKVFQTNIVYAFRLRNSSLQLLESIENYCKLLNSIWHPMADYIDLYRFVESWNCKIVQLQTCKTTKLQGC